MKPEMPPFHINKAWQVSFAIIIVTSWVIVHQHFTQMDERFFQSSIQGALGLLNYELGDYKAAAKAYRAHFVGAEHWKEGDDDASNALLRGDIYSAEKIAKADLKRPLSQSKAWLTLGEVALSKGDNEEARKWLNRVLKKERDQFDALLLLSIIDARLARDNESIASLNLALRSVRVEKRLSSFLWVLEIMGTLKASSNALAHHTLLAHYFRYLSIFDESNRRRARLFAEKGIGNNNHLESAYLTLGIIHQKEGHIKKALHFYKKSIDVNSNYSEAYRRLASIYSSRGELAKEYEMTKLAYETAQNDLFYFEDYQDFLTEKLGDYYQALTLTEKRLKDDPQNSELIKSAAFYLRFVGKEEEAIVYYQQGLKTHPFDAELYEGIGLSLTALEKFDEALKAFQGALSINNRRSRTHAALGLLHAKANRKPEAIEAFETAFRYGYRSNSQRLNLCTLYQTTSRFEEAVRCLRRVLSEEPRNAYANNMLVYTLKNLDES